MELDAFQWAALVGTWLGSLVGSYFVATKATKRQMDAEPAPRTTVHPSLPSIPDGLASLTPRLEALERELRQEVRALEGKITVLAGEALTVEEFQAYVTVDSERRERLIAKIAELQGSLAAMFPRMRK